MVALDERSPQDSRFHLYKYNHEKLFVGAGMVVLPVHYIVLVGSMCLRGLYYDNHIATVEAARC